MYPSMCSTQKVVSVNGISETRLFPAELGIASELVLTMERSVPGPEEAPAPVRRLWAVSATRAPDEAFGADVDPVGVIGEIRESGVLAAWNRLATLDKEVRKGDRVVAVNGIAEEKRFAHELASAKTLILTLERFVPVERRLFAVSLTRASEEDEFGAEVEDNGVITFVGTEGLIPTWNIDAEDEKEGSSVREGDKLLLVNGLSDPAEFADEDSADDVGRCRDETLTAARRWLGARRRRSRATRAAEEARHEHNVADWV